MYLAYIFHKKIKNIPLQLIIVCISKYSSLILSNAGFMAGSLAPQIARAILVRSQIQA
jgi:predicted membrane protein